METKPIIHIAATHCHSELEEKFNKWYNEVHIPMSLKFEGLKEVTRYKLISKIEGHLPYLSICRFDNIEAFKAYEVSPERAAASEEMNQTWKYGGFEIEWRLQYELIKNWKR